MIPLLIGSGYFSQMLTVELVIILSELSDGFR